MSLLLSSCIQKNKIEIALKGSKLKSPTFTVSNIQVVNHQIVITGTNLSAVSNFRVNEGSNNFNMQIESKTSTSLIANTVSNVTFAAGKVFDFILSNASAASTFTINFSLCDSTLGGKAFNCTLTPNDRDVLSYDASTGKWAPRAVNGLSYQGAYDASGGTAPATTNIGDYYIISVAGTIGAVPYAVGDWIVLSAVGDWEKINNSNMITSVFGRTGAVTATKGDYTLTKMSDVDLTTTPPVLNDVLKFDGTNWVPGTIAVGGGGTVTAVSGTAPISVATGTTTPVISMAAATTAVNGYLTSADWNTFNNKQASITAGTTAQYYRGDKSFQTLDTSVVPENTNLYFTNARVLGVPLTGFDNTLAGTIAATDTVLQAFGKTQKQIDGLTTGSGNYLLKNAADTLSGAISLTNVITATVTGDVVVNSVPLTITSAVNKTYVDTADALKLAKAGDTMSGVLTLDNDLKIKGGNANYVTVKGHATTAAYDFILPSSAGTSGYVLQTDGAGNLSWLNPSSVALAANSVASGNIIDGTIVDADINASAAIAQSKIANLTTDLAAKQSTTLASGKILVGSAGNVATAVDMSGDATIVSSGAVTLKNTGTAGTYTSVTTDAQGRVTAGSNPAVVSSVTVTAPVTLGGTASVPLIGMPVATTTVDGYLAATDWTIFNNKQAAITAASTLTTGSITTNLQGGVVVNPYGTAAGETGEIRLKELAANGVNYVGLKSPDALAANVTFILPTTEGTAGQVLSTNGTAGTPTLSWVTPASAPVTSVNTLTGAVVLSTTEIAEGSNLYHTDARTLAAPLTGYATGANSTILNTDTVLGAFQKAQGQINAREASITAGTTAQYFRGDKTFQTLDTSVVPENTNLYFTNARALAVPLTGFSATTGAIVATDTALQAFNKAQGQISALTTASADYLVKNGADTISGTVALTNVITASATGDVIVNSVPLTLTSAVNKTYVDTGDALKVAKAGDTMSGVLTLDSDLKIKGGNANYVTVKGHATTAAYNFILPSSAGTSGYVLQTDGAGNLSWANPASVALGADSVASSNIIDGAIVDADINATAAIAQSKIANLTTDLAAKQSTTLASGKILVGSAGNVAAAVDMSGDATIVSSGAVTLKNTGTAGTYTSVTTDAQGRVTAGSNPVVVTSVTATAPITVAGTAAVPLIAMPVATTTVDGYLAATDWTIFNNKQAAITAASTLTTGSITTNLQGGVVVNPYGTAAGETGEIRLKELAANGTNYVAFKSPDALAANVIYTMPAADGSSGQFLTTNASGVLSWTSGSAATVTSVTSANTDIAVATTTTTPVLTLNSGTGNNQILKLNGSAQIPAVDGSLLTSLNPANLSAAVAVGKGGTGLTAGTSGGIPYYNSTSTMASSALLTLNGVVLGGGAGATPATSAAGTADQVFRVPAAGGAPAFGAIDLTKAAAVTGALPIANGGTGATTAAAARTALGLADGSTYAVGTTTGTIPLIGTGGVVADNICVADAAGGGVSCSVANTSAGLRGLITDESGTGALLFGTAPTISNPVITNIAPGADFTLTQNSVAAITSENTGAVVNTLYLKAGKVGVGTTAPGSALDVKGTLRLSGSTSGYVGFAPAATAGTTTYLLPATQGTAGQVLSTDGVATTPTLSWVSAATGSVTSVTSANTDMSIATTTSTPVITLNSGTGNNQILKLNGSAQIPAVDGSLLTSLNPANLSAAVSVAKGGTGLTAGTSGGIPYYNSTSTMASSALLTLNGVVLGGGAGATPATTAAGTADQVLRVPGAGGAPAFGAIDLTKAAAVTGALPIANGGTGATTAAAARTALGLADGSTYAVGTTTGTIPLIGTGGVVADNICVADAAGGGVSCSVANTSAGLRGLVSDESGTGALLFGTSPTISSPVITNIAPGADFTLTQNSVAAITSENTGAVVNTLYLKAGKVGVGTTAPGSALDVKGTLRLSGSTSGYVGFAPAATAGTTTYLLPTTQGTAGQLLSTDGVATTPTLSWVTAGTVSSVTSANTDIGVATTTSTPVLTLNSGTGNNQILKLNGSAQIPAVDGSLLTSLNPANLSAAVSVAKGGTGLTAGTSGGIPYFSSTSTMASSALLTLNGVVLGGGAGATPATTAAGTADQVLRVPGAGGAPAFGAIDLTKAAAVTGALPIANGGTGATSASAARTALGLADGSTYAVGTTTGTIPLIGTGGVVANNFCVADAAGGGVSCSVANTSAGLRGLVSDESGTGALLFGTSPTISSPVITNIAPGADFTLTQNSVAAITSENTGAVVNTLYLKAGKVGVGTTAPGSALDVKGTLRLSGSTSGYVGFAPAATAGTTTYLLPTTQGSAGQILSTDGVATTPTLSWVTAGTVSSVTSANTDISVATTTSTPVLTLNSGTGNNQILKLNGSAQIPAVDGSLLTSLNPANLSAAVSVAKGGTGLTAGTSGGIPYFSSTSTMASSALLTLNGVVLGGGAGATPATTAAGTADQVLRVPGAGGAPAFGAIDLTKSAAVTGALPIANGGTGSTTAANARTALGLASASTVATGSTTGSVPLVGTGGVVANNLCAGDSSGGGISCSVANTSAGLLGLISDETGTGALVFGTAPTISNPVIANISPAANFTLTQNSVAPFTSEGTGATTNTLYLKAGKVGIGTNSPNSTLDVRGPASVDANGMTAAWSTALGVVGNLSGGGADAYGIVSQATVTNASVTSSYSALYAQAKTSAAAFTLPIAYGLYVANPSKGAGSTITTNYGLYVEAPTSGATNHAAIFAGGDVGIGTASPWGTLHVAAATGDPTTIFIGNGIAGRSTGWIGTTADTGGYLEMQGVAIEGTSWGNIGLNVAGGNVGIGTGSPSYKLHVVGTAGLSTGTAWTNASDIRLKDIQGDYPYGLDEVLKLHTVRYNYKKGNPLDLPSDFTKTGFIAQEVQKVIPEAVSKRSDGYLELNVDPIHWAVVNAIKDLFNKYILPLFENDKRQDRAIASVTSLTEKKADKSEVIQLKQENALLKKENSEIKARLDKIEKMLLKTK